MRVAIGPAFTLVKDTGVRIIRRVHQPASRKLPRHVQCILPLSIRTIEVGPTGAIAEQPPEQRPMSKDR
ncbi:MAG: hypothetical protein ACI9DC_005206 [Gammaproteobacteria bacterium]|jgi:hypothetical protein